MYLLLADDPITWEKVAMEAIRAAVFIVPILSGVAYAYFKLKEKLLDNTAKTEKSAAKTIAISKDMVEVNKKLDNLAKDNSG